MAGEAADLAGAEPLVIRLQRRDIGLLIVGSPAWGAGDGGWTERQLAGVVTRDTMIGVAIPAGSTQA